MSNQRSQERRKNVSTLNALAKTYSLRVKISNIGNAKPKSVERLIKTLQLHCWVDSEREEIRAAAEMYVKNGGKIDGNILPQDSAPASQPASGCSPVAVPRHKILVTGYRLQSHAFMPTYNNRDFRADAWPRFRDFVRGFARRYASTAWAACLEETLHPDSSVGDSSLTHPTQQDVFHTHAYLYWKGGDGVSLRNTDPLVFEGVKPRVDACTVMNPMTMRDAACQGLYYVYVKKLGTLEVASNYLPWRDYVPKGEWIMSLWGAHKITHEQFESLSMQIRRGHTARMKDLEAVLRTERAVNVRTHVESEAKLLAEHAPLNPMRRDIAEVEAFISSFGPTNFSWRRPILVITGPTRLGKSLLAADVLLRVAKLLGLHRYLEVTVEDDVNLDLSAFDVSKHSGVLLDGVGDALMLEHHREALQGRPKTSTGGRSATMVYSYPFSLARRGVIATMDPSAKNLEALQTHHWLSDRRNVIWVDLTTPAWV